MVEYDKTNVFMMKRIFCGDTYKLNVFHGSFIEGDRYTTEGIDIFSLEDAKAKKPENKNFIKKIKGFGGKFDVIMGNPPFQKFYNNINNRVGGSNFFSIFINKSFKFLNNNKLFLFITPCSWMTGSTNKQSGNLLSGIFKKNTILFLNIQECSKYFKNIASTFSYYIIKKSKENIKFNCICKYKSKIYDSYIYNNDFRKLSIIPIIFNNIIISIILKLININKNKFNFQRLRDLDRSNKTTKIRYIKNGINCVRHKVTEIFQTNYVQECMNKNKIIISKPGYLKTMFDYNCGCSDATLFMYVKNKDEGLKIQKVLNFDVYKVILNSYRELTGFNNEKNINNLSIIYNINDIKLTSEEVKLIKDLV